MTELRAKLKRAPKPVPDKEIRALLDRYRCAVPFHAVRTRFLGSIASPGLSVAPLETVKALWDGELPPFDNLDAVNELLSTLIVGLWNTLSRHQDRRVRFRLMRLGVAATSEGIARIAFVRSEELGASLRGCLGKLKVSTFPSGPIARWTFCRRSACSSGR